MNGHQTIFQFTYCTKDDYRHREIFLHEQFQQSRTIPGTQKLHGFIHLMQNKLHANAKQAPC